MIGRLLLWRLFWLFMVWLDYETNDSLSTNCRLYHILARPLTSSILLAPQANSLRTNYKKSKRWSYLFVLVTTEMPIPKVYTPPGSRGGRESQTNFCRSLTSLCDRHTYQQVAVTWCSSLLHSRSLVNTCFHVFFKQRSSLVSLLIFHLLYWFEKFLFGCLIIFRVHIHTVRSSTRPR